MYVNTLQFNLNTKDCVARSSKGNDQNSISVNYSAGYDVDVSDHSVYDVMRSLVTSDGIRTEQ